MAKRSRRPRKSESKKGKRKAKAKEESGPTVIVSPMVQLRYTLKRTALDKMLLGDEEGEGAQYASLAADDPGPSDEEFFKLS